jgi:DNA modification methylase
MAVIDQASGANWHLWNGDCVAVARALPDASVGYTIYSPPFISLYTFSDDPRDMSNCRSDDQFWTHYKFLIAECYRITKPGRLVSIHCMNLPTSKLRDGFIGLRDFRGDIIKAHQEAGFYYHSEVVIRKDPVSAMQRTKAIGLLHKQICKDSCLSRMAVPDYIITMRKPGENAMVDRVDGQFDAYYGSEASPTDTLPSREWNEDAQKMVPSISTPGTRGYSIAVWQRYAEPVWMDIAQSDVLSRKEAREEADEAHIAPLQLTPIRRCVDLWSNPGDTVFSPFAGIGSELYVSLQMGRRAIGAELKPSYWRQGVQNCERAAASVPAKARVVVDLDAVRAELTVRASLAALQRRLARA